MDVYKYSFTVLSAANCSLGYLSTRTDQLNIDDLENEPLAEKSIQSTTKDAKEFQKVFFTVYIFAVAADALQSPYMYTLYRDEKHFSEPMVAALFAIGFISAAISSSFVGDLADRYGRKYACQWFCAVYSVSCLLVVSSRWPLLVVGRIFGGVGVSLMASVFETWMVSEYHTREMRDKGLDITLVFGRMTTTNCIVSIVAGVAGQILVDQTGTKVAPFMAALVCLGVAAVLISGLWPENYGTKTKLREDGVGGGTDTKTIIQDKRILTLSLISCIFEGTLCLFTFFWPATIKSAHASAIASTTTTTTEPPTQPPFGLTFATFTGAAMLGSLAFTQSNHSITPPSMSQTLKLILAIASASLLAIVQAKPESLTLWAFCALHACVGIYSPTIGYLKEQLIPDGIRGKTYGLLKLPMYVGVVFALILVREGDKYRNNTFLVCTGLLVVACGVCHRYLRF